MRFKGIDLNLLGMLQILLEERSVSRTAQRLHLSQPAVSAALARLRTHFNDELLVLEGKRMFPTPLADALSPQVTHFLEIATGILDSSSAFDPAVSGRTFRLTASDYVLSVIVAPLIRKLAEQAPGIRLIVEPPGDRTAARLEEGKVDLLVTPEEFASSFHPMETAFDERFVVVGWNRNAAFDSSITEEDFLRLEHVAVMVGADAPGAVADRQLEQLGKHRYVRATVFSFSAMPLMVVGTQLIGLMHERLAVLAREQLPIAISPLPFGLSPLREVFQYHRARSNDAGLQWLRKELATIAGLTARSSIASMLPDKMKRLSRTV